MTDLRVRADALRALAAALRSGDTLGEALSSWHRRVPAAARATVAPVGRRVRLGQPPSRALAAAAPLLERDLGAVTALVDLHQGLGGDLAAMLDALALRIDGRAAAYDAACAATAAATLSAKLVAGLPLLLVPFVPGMRSMLFDPAGFLSLAAGVLLGGAGFAWMRRLVPHPETDDAAAWIADVATAAARAGAGYGAALHALASTGFDDDLARAARVVRLGRPWPAALRSAGEGPAALAEVLARSDALGVPAATALDAFACTRRRQMADAFERKVKRASVLMVVPLALCVLPSAALIALAPFVRRLAGT
ncbi:MAG: hypothetical protein ABR575_09820 [Actinomycetota bacterium]